MTDGLLRRRDGHDSHRVTFAELFFDLVFVFAVTQLSHRLLAHLSVRGTLETGLLLLAVWWVWVYTAWVTNWLDPQKAPVRLMLYAVMLAGLVMSAAIPTAFEGRALPFALAYVAIQVGRTIFTLWALRVDHPRNFRNFQRIAAWLIFSGLFWIAGALASGDARLALWVAALAIECVGPSAGFWTPGMSRSTTADWDISGAHMAERCGLFVIIALGESVLVTGATFANLSWTGDTVIAFVIGFVGSVAMWWIYFNIGAERASRLIAGSSDPGRHARLAYTYIHLLLVAGIVVCAVGDEMILNHPHGRADAKTIAVLAGGPALFVLGNLLFKWVTAGWPPLSHQIGLGLLAILAIVGPFIDTLVLGAAASLILIVVAAWETISLKAR